MQVIKPGLEFVYEAEGQLDAPREIGAVVDGTRRIIPIVGGAAGIKHPAAPRQH